MIFKTRNIFKYKLIFKFFFSTGIARLRIDLINLKTFLIHKCLIREII